MSQKRAKQPRPKQMSDAEKMASYMADPSLLLIAQQDQQQESPR